MTKEEKKERRELRHWLYKNVVTTKEARLTCTPAQLRKACRIVADRYLAFQKQSAAKIS